MFRPGLALLFITLVVAPASAQHRLLLRDTTLVTGSIRSVNPDGVTLQQEGAAKTYGWDEIDSGIAPDQKKFDSYLREIGDPLFRVRQRLKAGDYLEMSAPAEKLFPLFVERSSGVAEAVSFATHLARDARHRREMALEPLLACLAMRSRAGHATEPRFAAANNRKLTLDAIGLVREFPPVFFDETAAREALASYGNRLRQWPGGKPTLGARIYVASLANCAGDFAAALEIEKSLADQPAVAEWRTLLAAQREIRQGAPRGAVEAMRAKLDTLHEPARMVGIYFSGLAGLKATPAGREPVISFLSLPARYGTTSPELAAAGLYHAALSLEKESDSRAALAVRKELLTRFSATYFGSRLARESTTPNPGGLQ